MSKGQLLMDPRVSRLKFEREVDSLMRLAPDLRKSRGWIIESVEYPIVRVTFLVTNTTPPIVAFTAEIDFSNYNYLPLSVRFLNPVNFASTKIKGFRMTNQGPQNVIVEGHPITREDFLCLPSIWEYHSHPQHSGDSWDLHRYDRGEGTMYFILDFLWLYCVKTIKGFQVPMPSVIYSQSAMLVMGLDQ